MPTPSVGSGVIVNCAPPSSSPGGVPLLPGDAPHGDWNQAVVEVALLADARIVESLHADHLRQLALRHDHDPRRIDVNHVAERGHRLGDRVRARHRVEDQNLSQCGIGIAGSVVQDRQNAEPVGRIGADRKLRPAQQQPGGVPLLPSDAPHGDWNQAVVEVGSSPTPVSLNPCTPITCVNAPTVTITTRVGSTLIT